MTTLTFSYTFLDAFDSCPEKARNLFVTKAFTRTYVAAQGGIDAHKELEKRLRDKTALPEALAKAEPYVQSLERLGHVETEIPLAVDHWLNATPFWGTSGMGPKIVPLLRGKFDIVIRNEARAFLGDWKTGKVREKTEQLELGALLLMRNDQKIETVTAANIWLAAGQVTTPAYVFRQADTSALWAKWLKRMRLIESLDAAAVWPRRPSGLCGWCPVATCPDYRGG